MQIGFALALTLGCLSVAPVRAQAGGSQYLQLLRQHKYAEAITATDAALKQQPKQADLWFYRALAEQGLGRSAESLGDMQHALQLNPGFLQAAEAGAQIAYRGHEARAADFLRQVLRLEPANQTAHAMLTVLALEKPDCQLALTHFQQAGELATTDATTVRRIGLCRAQVSADAGDLPSAQREIAALRAADPQDIPLATAEAQLEIEQKQTAEAVTTLTPLRGSLSAFGLRVLASAQAQQGDVVAAVDTYRESIRREPTDQNGYLDLAILSMEHQSPDVALSVLNSGLKANANAIRLLVARGTVYAQIGKDDLAQADFEQADHLAPNSTYGALGMGVLLREDGNLDEAAGVLEKKLASNPGNPLLAYMLADVLVRKGASPGDPSFTRAEHLLQTAIHAQPSLAQAHALRGKLLLKQGQTGQAIQELEAAIALQPNDRTALNQLVAAYRRTGRTADAERTSARLEAGVAAERAQDNDRNRVHLSLATAETAGSTSAMKQESRSAPQP